jgi:hypothetical protein
MKSVRPVGGAQRGSSIGGGERPGSAQLSRWLTEKPWRGDSIVYRRAEVCISRGWLPKRNASQTRSAPMGITKRRPFSGRAVVRHYANLTVAVSPGNRVLAERFGSMFAAQGARSFIALTHWPAFHIKGES